MSDRGLIGLYDKVKDYLPWFRPKLVNGETVDISIHQLLTHTSRLIYAPALENMSADKAVSMGALDTDLDLEANFSRHNEFPLAFRPGSKFEYSFSSDILGGSLEDAVVLHYVAGPLGMKDTRFHVIDAERLAVPYMDFMPAAVFLKLCFHAKLKPSKVEPDRTGKDLTVENALPQSKPFLPIDKRPPRLKVTVQLKTTLVTSDKSVRLS